MTPTISSNRLKISVQLQPRFQPISECTYQKNWDQTLALVFNCFFLLTLLCYLQQVLEQFIKRVVLLLKVTSVGFCLLLQRSTDTAYCYDNALFAEETCNKDPALLCSNISLRVIFKIYLILMSDPPYPLFHR
jgi:hypothetical protein